MQAVTTLIAEHIYLAEGSLFASMGQALAIQPNPDWKAKTRGKTEFLEHVIVIHDRKAQAPAYIVLQGKMTCAGIMNHFDEAGAKPLKFIEQIDQSQPIEELAHSELLGAKSGEIHKVFPISRTDDRILSGKEREGIAK